MERKYIKFGNKEFCLEKKCIVAVLDLALCKQKKNLHCRGNIAYLKSSSWRLFSAEEH